MKSGLNETNLTEAWNQVGLVSMGITGCAGGAGSCTGGTGVTPGGITGGG